MTPASRANNRGVTLIEAVCSIVVLSIAIPPLVGLYTEIAHHSVSDTYQDVAVTLAESLMEEVVSKAFEDPDEGLGSFGTEEGTRPAYDDVDDFDGMTNSPPQRLDGTVLDEYEGFTRSVTVENVTFADPDPITPEADGSTSYKRIKVKVSWSSGQSGEITLTTERSWLTGGAGPGPMHLGIAQTTPCAETNKKIELSLVNIETTDRELSSFDLSADVATEQLKKVKLGNKDVWVEGLGVDLPIVGLAVNEGTADERTVYAGASKPLNLEFLDAPAAGTVTYTVVLYFTDLSSFTWSFSIVWPGP